MDIVVSGNYAYIASGAEGLKKFNISDHSSIVEIGAVDTPGYAKDVAVSGNYAYIADDVEGLRIIDISDPTSPLEVGFVKEIRIA